jgi:hypothetical protein
MTHDRDGGDVIDASNFATEDDDRRQMSDVDMIEKARALAAEDDDTDEGPGAGPAILGIPITRRNLIIGAGAAVGGVAAIAVLLSVIGGCSHKEEPTPAPKPQIADVDEDPFAATTTASMDGPVDMMGEQLTVGTALSAIREMLAQVGTPQFDGDGMMQKGVIVRHLILPAHTRQSIAALELLHEHFGENILVSLMCQYVPWGEVKNDPKLGRTITRREYDKVKTALFRLGMDGFTQDLSSATADYIPDWDFEN